jgi:predicted nucleic-acid-binding protein
MAVNEKVLANRAYQNKRNAKKRSEAIESIINHIIENKEYKLIKEAFINE